MLKYLLLSNILIISATMLANSEIYGYNYADQLSSTETFDIGQDTSGNIWICTDRGVVKYNGQVFTHLGASQGLPPGAVLEVERDPEGRLWFVSEQRLVYYLEQDSFISAPFNDFLRINSRDIFDFKIGSDGVFYLYLLHSYISITGDHIKRSEEPASNQIIIDPGSEAAFRYNFNSPDEDFQLFYGDIFITNSIISHKSHNWVCRGQGDEVYFTDRYQLFRMDGTGLIKETILDKKITKLLGYYNGELIAAAEEGGILIIDPVSLKIKKHIYSKYSCSKVFFDEEGGMWTTTLENGVYYIPAHQLRLKHYFGDQKITDVKTVSEGVYFSTSYGNYFLADHSTIPDTIFEDKGWGHWYLSSKGDTLLATGNRSLRLAPRGVVEIRKGFSKAVSIGKDAVYYGHSLHITKTDHSGNKILEANLAEQLDKSEGLWDLKDMSLSGEYLWLATTRGLLQITKNTLEVKQRLFEDEHFRSIVIADFPRDTFIIAGTHQEGAYIISGNDIYHITKEKGLASNYITDITLGSDSAVWISTHSGINRFFLSNLGKDSMQIESYNRFNALLSDQVNAVSYKDGRVFIGTNRGLEIISFKDKVFSYPEKKVMISSVQVDGEPQSANSDIVMTPGNKLLEIFFSTPAFYFANDIEYQYKLSSLSSKWNFLASGALRLFSLPPGEYELQVRYKRANGVWSASHNVINLIVQPPWYKTWWFRALLVGFLVFLALAFGWWQLNRQRNKMDQEFRINKLQYQAITSQMNPHFVFNSLNSIHNFILRNDREASSTYLSAFARLIRSILDNSQHEVISLENICTNLQHYLSLEQLRLKLRLTYQLNISPEVDRSKIHLPSMLLQPFVENAIWHGIAPKKEGGMVSIDMRKVKDKLNISIEDNGIGRDEALQKNRLAHKPGRSVGMMLTTKRFELMSLLYGAPITYAIHDLYDSDGIPQGTRVVIQIPIKDD